MRKPELIAAIVNDTQQPRRDVERTVNSLLEVITAELAKGGDVALIGFGTFSIKKREARDGRNPQTGEPMKIAAAKLPAFKAGSKLKDAVS